MLTSMKFRTCRWAPPTIRISLIENLIYKYLRSLFASFANGVCQFRTNKKNNNFSNHCKNSPAPDQLVGVEIPKKQHFYNSKWVNFMCQFICFVRSDGNNNAPVIVLEKQKSKSMYVSLIPVAVNASIDFYVCFIRRRPASVVKKRFLRLSTHFFCVLRAFRFNEFGLAAGRFI